MGAACEAEVISKFVVETLSKDDTCFVKLFRVSTLRYDSVLDMFASIFNRTLLVYAQVSENFAPETRLLGVILRQMRLTARAHGACVLPLWLSN